MIFRQFQDPVSNTLTYIMAKSKGSEALIIDPVIEQIDEYALFLEEHNLKLVKAMDTHTHADHITGLAELRKRFKCITIMGKECATDMVSMRISDGDLIEIDGITLKAIHTPGHTDESYCYYMEGMVFTGDTLMIRGTGRTDFQNGDASLQYDSIVNKLFTLPDSTTVYPGHDYKGESISTIALEKKLNPRLAGKTKEEYVKLMSELNLAYPKMMNIAVPANLSIGKDVNNNLLPQQMISSKEAREKYLSKMGFFFVDLREINEIKNSGTIEGSLHIPYQKLEMALNDTNSEIVSRLKNGEIPIYICSYGERSALAVELTREILSKESVHVKDGFEGWFIENN